jgi:FkbM family methyltransferase
MGHQPLDGLVLQFVQTFMGLEKIVKWSNIARKVVFHRAPMCSLQNSAWGVVYNALGPRIMYRRCSLVESDSGCELWNTPTGPFWIPSGGGRNVLAPLVAQQEAKIYGQAIESGDVVIDCGAHVGTFTRFALAHGASLVVALEPSPDNLRCLYRNLKSEIDQHRVVVVEQCVSDHSGSVVLQMEPASNSWETRISESGPGLTVQAITLDALVIDLGVQRVDFIKMDIEGAEKAALRGAARILADYRPTLAIAAYHLDDDAERIPQLVGLGYRMSCRGCKDAVIPASCRIRLCSNTNNVPRGSDPQVKIS